MKWFAPIIVSCFIFACLCGVVSCGIGLMEADQKRAQERWLAHDRQVYEAWCRVTSATVSFEDWRVLRREGLFPVNKP